MEDETLDRDTPNGVVDDDDNGVDDDEEEDNTAKRLAADGRPIQASIFEVLVAMVVGGGESEKWYLLWFSEFRCFRDQHGLWRL